MKLGLPLHIAIITLHLANINALYVVHKQTKQRQMTV